MQTLDEKEVVRCRKEAYKFLARREHSAHELGRKLARRFATAVIERILGELAAEKLLDDRRFAVTYVRDLLRRTPCGLRLIRRKLAERGVDEENVSAALDELAPDEGLLIEQAAREKLAKLIRYPREVAARRLLSHLKRRGFPRGLAQSVTLELLEDWPE
ncbi:MAG: hypothetical protein GF399_07185 [Candidatus Coatesbacteria bacterium]|nr:hypothetical protein [Candidatus Coatesbacteria bacterium]